MRVLGQPVFIRRGSTGKVDGVGLRHIGGQGARCSPDLLAIVGCAGAVHVEAGQNLGNRLVDSEYNLDVACGVLAGNGDGILSTDGGRLGQDGVFDAPFDLDDSGMNASASFIIYKGMHTK